MGTSPLELAIILPTLNERGNLTPLVERIEAALGPVGWEVLVVDDNSSDGTADEARALALSDSRIRVIQRIGRRGLASAAIEGLCATAAPYAAVMDADHQHDPALLTGVALTDPMSGYFMLPSASARTLAPRLSGIGFKILLDLLASSDEPMRVRELPLNFAARREGESKLDRAIAFDFLAGLFDKTIGTVVPTRFAVWRRVCLCAGDSRDCRDELQLSAQQCADLSRFAAARIGPNARRLARLLPHVLGWCLCQCRGGDFAAIHGRLLDIGRARRNSGRISVELCAIQPLCLGPLLGPKSSRQSTPNTGSCPRRPIQPPLGRGRNRQRAAQSAPKRYRPARAHRVSIIR